MKLQLVVAMVALLAIPAAVHACSCIAPPPPKTALAQAHAVFVGKVTKIDKAGEHQLLVTLEASTTWKGVKEKVVTLRTANDSAACGFGFEVGKSYLVYAYLTGEEGAKDRMLGTNICTRTRLLNEEAKAEVAELGPAEKMPKP